jgi:hypothetical protein
METNFFGFHCEVAAMVIKRTGVKNKKKKKNVKKKMVLVIVEYSFN